MAILEGDIKILASQVLDDVPEGGGAATGTEIVDGQSNNLFNDISELDRVYGDVSLRKVFIGVDTPDTDGYFGVHAIVRDAPDDPDVSTVLFTTESYFDTRSEAAGRIEAYLAQGPLYQGLLFGNHIAGQMTVMLIQRSGVPVPAVGDTIMLRKAEGLVSQVDQYVRVTAVASTLSTFTDVNGGEFQRLVVTLSISDQLREDFPGFQALYYDAAIDYVGKSKVYGTVVADAARYFGISPLAVAGSLGDFTVQVEGIFSQLVPSSRAETPIADARMNQQLAALVTAGASISRTLTLAFGPTQQLFAGGGIQPGSLSVVRGGVTLTDEGGRLMNAGVAVGVVDYANGVLALSSDVFGGGSGEHAVTFVPAGAPSMVTESLGIPVSQASQRLTYVLTLEPAPARGSTQVSFLAQGRWYVLQDDGSGALRGGDSSFGAGMVNFESGTVSITLGALPDVGSQVIVTWAQVATAEAVTSPKVGNSQRFAKEIQTGGPIKPGTLTITWNDGTARSATDSAGTLVGDAQGLVYYGSGRILFSPNALPAPATAIACALTRAGAVSDQVVSFANGGSTWQDTLGGPIKPRSFELAIKVQHPVRQYPGTDTTAQIVVRVFDDGGGNLQVANGSSPLTVGTINYTTGAIAINKTVGGFKSVQGDWDKVAYGSPGQLGFRSRIVYRGTETRTVTLTFLNGSVTPASKPVWGWWLGTTINGVAAYYRLGGADGAVSTFNTTLDEVVLLDAVSYELSSNEAIVAQAGIDGTSLVFASRFWSDVLFVLGGQVHRSVRAAVAGGVPEIHRNPSPATGEGTLVGTAPNSGRRISLTQWTSGISPVASAISGTETTGVSGASSLYNTDGVVFRTASAPIAPAGFNLLGTFADGETFNVVADEDGFINGSDVVGRVSYESGVVEVRFGAPHAGPASTTVEDVSDMGVPGVSFLELRQARADTLRYNAVAYSYIPLDADILGLDPVRLPADGRVPIFRAGTVAVVHHTAQTAPAAVSNGQTINVGRQRLARVRVIGANGATIPGGYSADLNAGTVTFANVAGYSQPVRIEHRIEDAALIADAQLSGLLRLTRPITHAYPLGSHVSSALLIGDLRARMAAVFDQATWTNVWSDDLIGSQANATFDLINNPGEVTNAGAITERWALIFTGTTTFNILGEHLGVVGTGSTSTDVEPLNPVSMTPYFSLPAAGFGAGWSIGNVIRINTVGARAPIWVARVVQQGEATEDDDSFSLLVRGDIDTP